MNIMNVMKSGVALCLLWGASGSAWAHDAWIAIDGPAHAVRYGHTAAGDPYDPAKIRQVRAWSANGDPVAVAVERSADGATATPASDAAVLTLDFDNGYWSRVGGQSRNEARTVTGAAEGTQSLKYGKTVLSWGDVVTRPLGQPLELVAVSATAPRDRQKVNVQVLHEGRPLAGARVYAGGHDDEAPVTTDANGRAAIEVHRGTQMLGVAHSVAHDGPEADRVNLSANLLFKVE
ncbi:DUF4198 domain-containing protein [Sinimarinibacterium flocculans]